MGDGEAMLHLQYCTCAGQIYADDEYGHYSFQLVAPGLNKEPSFVQFKPKLSKISTFFSMKICLVTSMNGLFGSVTLII